MPFDIRVNPYASTVDRNLYLVLEAMRAHMCGPERDGSLGYEEYDDRYVVSFDPCGSGGRSMRGDEVEGTGSRVLAPYEFGVTTGEARLGLERGGHLLLLCALLLRAREAARRALGAPRARGRSASLGWHGRRRVDQEASAPGPSTSRSRRSPQGHIDVSGMTSRSFRCWMPHPRASAPEGLRPHPQANTTRCSMVVVVTPARPMTSLT